MHIDWIDCLRCVPQRKVDTSGTSFWRGAPEVIERLANRLVARLGSLDAAGIHNPSYRRWSREEETRFILRINDSGGDLALMGFGAPKQKRWRAEHLGSIDVAAMIGAAAAFGFLFDRELTSEHQELLSETPAL